MLSWTSPLYIEAQENGEFDYIELYLSQELKPTNLFEWHVLENDFGEPPFNSAAISIVEVPDGNFVQIDDWDQSLNEVFEVSFDGSVYPRINDDLYFLFFSFTMGIYENGVEINPAEKQWIYFVYDDFYFAEKAGGNVTIIITENEDLVTYNGSLIHEDGNTAEFFGIIDKSLGLMRELKIVNTREGVEQIFHLQGVDKLTLENNLENPLTLELGPIFLSLIILCCRQIFNHRKISR